MVVYEKFYFQSWKTTNTLNSKINLKQRISEWCLNFSSRSTRKDGSDITTFLNRLKAFTTCHEGNLWISESSLSMLDKWGFFSFFVMLLFVLFFPDNLYSSVFFGYKKVKFLENLVIFCWILEKEISLSIFLKIKVWSIRSGSRWTTIHYKWKCIKYVKTAKMIPLSPHAVLKQISEYSYPFSIYISQLRVYSVHRWAIIMDL